MSAASGAISSCSGSVSAAGSAWGPEFMSITAIRLNGYGYSPWAKFVEVYLTAKGQNKYLTDAPPDPKDPSHAAWKNQGCSDLSSHVE